MSNGPAYPPDLAAYVVAHWPAHLQLSLSPRLLEEALSVAFQASLTLEEGRPTRFRLLLTAMDQLPEQGMFNEGVLRLPFEQSRPLDAHELRRLAPSAPFESALIGAEPRGDTLVIWGLAHSGAAWLAPSWGGRLVVPNWTYDPIVHVSGPGNLAVRCAGELVGALERGNLVDTTLDVFHSLWLEDLFAQERQAVKDEYERGQATVPSPTTVETTLIGRVSQHMLRRALKLIRGSGHGGLLLITDTAREGAHALQGLQLKYPFSSEEPTRRYRSILLQLLAVIAARTQSHTIGWEHFVGTTSSQLEALEQSVFEWSTLIANLSAVDGAVVLDKRFGLLGFGAEVSPTLPTPLRAFRALDLEGLRTQDQPIDAFGTRHRAALRFVNCHEGSLAAVVSQDGTMTLVSGRKGGVVCWEQSSPT